MGMPLRFGLNADARTVKYGVVCGFASCFFPGYQCPPGFYLILHRGLAAIEKSSSTSTHRKGVTTEVHTFTVR